MKSQKQIKFEEQRKDLTDREIQMEILYSNWVLQNQTGRTRSNISVITGILILGIILSVLLSLSA